MIEEIQPGMRWGKAWSLASNACQKASSGLNTKGTASACGMRFQSLWASFSVQSKGRVSEGGLQLAKLS
jgi:hypothetical protein